MRLRSGSFVRLVTIALACAFSAITLCAEPGQKQASLGADESTLEILYETGVACYKEGKYGEAVDAFLNVASINPHYRDMEYYMAFSRANLARQQGKAAQSPKEASASVNDEVKANAFYVIGTRYYGQEHYEEAARAFENALSILPDYRDAASRLALAKARMKERSAEGLAADSREEIEAIAAKERAIREARDAETARAYNAAMSEMKKRYYEQAIVGFQEILQSDPRHQGAWKNLVECYARQEEKTEEDAQRKVDLVREAKHKRLLKLYLKGRMLLKNYRPGEALKKFEEVVAVDPGFKDTKKWLMESRFRILANEREENGPAYTLGADDTVEITVRNHPELSGNVSIEPGGELILPLVNEVVMADDLTKEQLEEVIKGVLRKYIKDPDVRVVITGYNSAKWYILGEVGVRGEFTLGKARLTLMEALYHAGLPFEETAAMGRVLVIKPRKDQPHTTVVDVMDLLYKGKTGQNIYIEANDIIYVPKTVLHKITTVTAKWSAPMNATNATLGDIARLSQSFYNYTPWQLQLFGPPQKRRVPAATGSKR